MTNQTSATNSSIIELSHIFDFHWWTTYNVGPT